MSSSDGWIRITLDLTQQRIISTGFMRSEQFRNLLRNRQFTRLPNFE
jgi:hypothetical protein